MTARSRKDTGGLRGGARKVVRRSELDLLRQHQCVIDFDPEVTDGALDLHMSKRTRVIMHLL
jgi:hypothetical protein